jgi:hypothetical protein
VSDRSDSELPWGSEADDDVIEQGDERRRPGWPDRFRWRPRPGRLTLGLVLVALVAGVLGGYLAGNAHGRQQAAASRPAPTPAAASALADSLGLTEIGSQCSTVLGDTLQLGIEVVNTSGAGIQLGDVTARFPQGGLKLTVATWGPCGTLPYAHSTVNTVLPNGQSTWLSVTVTTLARCPQGLSVEYVASFSQHGRSDTVVLPGFADLGGVPVVSCPTP